MTQSLTYVEIDIPAFSLYQLDLQFEGSFDDSSPIGHIVTPNGNVQISTSQAYSGESSALFDGTSDWLDLDGFDVFAFGTENFIIDFYFRPNSLGATNQVLYESRAGSDGAYPTIYISGTTHLLVYYFNGADRIVGATTISTGAWYHCRCVRSGSNTNLYLDDVQQGSTFVNSDSCLIGASRPRIGCDTGGASQAFNGWIDSVRVMKGDPAEQTFRFTIDVSYLPADIDAVPSIRSVKITPSIVSLGQDLGQRATVEVLFQDHRHIFASESFDSGTFWGKFRGRYGLKLRGYPLRVLTGVVGDTLESMETRHYVIESTDGPTVKGEYKIIAKDILKFADGDRAQAPVLSQGFLLNDLTATSGTVTLSPSGIGDDYGVSGYVAIGGKEIASYTRLGIDEFDVLLIHGDFTGNSPDQIVDVLDTPHTITETGATMSAAQSKFGGASVSFGYFILDGSSDFAFGSEDFCVEFWARRPSTGSTHWLYDSRPAGTNGAYLSILFTASNALQVFVNSTQRIDGGSISANTWYHIAVARKDGITKAFVDGNQVGSNYTDATVYLNGASRPAMGTDGSNLGSNSFGGGFMDEIKVSKGAARFVQNFSPPTAAYSTTGSGDVLTIIRAQYNTEAQAHEASDRVQLCVEYLGEDVADVIYDLFINYANVDPSFITLANWQTETSTYLNTAYSALIAEPTAVNDLVSELIEQASLVIWWDDLEQQIRLRVLRAVSTDADIYNDDNILVDSLEVKEQPAKRISQVYTYFAKINPLVNQDQLENYASTAFAIDEDAELEYGSASIKKIFSRWIPAGGRAVANNVNTILLARFVTPPRLISFDAMRYAGTPPQLGLGYQIQGWPFQLQDGSADTVPVQITRLNPRADIFECEAEEVFAGAEAAPSSPDNHIILIDANTFNVNLRTMHDSLYTEAVSGDTVNCTILAGITVGSSTTANPAFDIGDWAVGVIVNLIVLGRIQGKGGQGGEGGPPATNNATVGLVGGVALYVRRAITLTDADGEIWGGGGGGGGGGASGSGAGGSGGGGAGTEGGAGGSATEGGIAAPGTSEAGGGGAGGGGGSGAGGTGGGPGLSGATGTSNLGTGRAGGSAGKAIDGISNVTTSGSAGDRRGGTV